MTMLETKLSLNLLFRSKAHKLKKILQQRQQGVCVFSFFSERCDLLLARCSDRFVVCATRLCVYYMHVFAFLLVSFVLPFAEICTNAIECTELWITRTLFLFLCVKKKRKKESKIVERREEIFVRKTFFGVNEKNHMEREREWDRTTTDHIQKRTDTEEQLHIASMSFRKELSCKMYIISVEFEFES